MPTLVYLLYGNAPTYQAELTYSVLSALRQARGETPRIVLYCDAVGARPDLPVETVILSEQTLNDWSMQGAYGHKVKLHVVGDALTRFGSKVCFVDTDTEFRKSPTLLFQRIARRESLMNACDGLLGEMSQWSEMLDLTAATDLAQMVRPDARMLNSGLIGVHVAQLGAIQDAIATAERLYRIKPVFNVEQFAVGHHLSQAGHVSFAEDVIEHYWGYRRITYHAKIPAALATLNGVYTRETARDLPEIIPARKPLIARIAARAYAGVHGLDKDARYAYLAYLSSRLLADRTDRRIMQSVVRQAVTAMPDSAGFVHRHMPGAAALL